MTINSFRTVKGVVDWRLCLGCGVCAYICPERKVTLHDFVQEGIRPVVADEHCGTCRLCLEVCPAIENDHRPMLEAPGVLREASHAFGPVLEVWEGHATDRDIRYVGSSGGILTALGLYCIEHEGMHGVLHIGGDRDRPMRNRTRMSRTRSELLSCAGSRYAPASACDALQAIEDAPTPCVFVGQPSEAAALRKAECHRPGLKAKVGLTLSFFCAGTPATQGTLELLRKRGFDPDKVEELRYRGLGWPGMFGVRLKGSEEFEPITTYKDSWGYLQRYRPYSVHLSPDFSGECADIASGDPWYRTVGENEVGSSILVVRTERGKAILQRARAAGYVELTPSQPSRAMGSQVNLIRRRGAIWGRLFMMRLMGIPAPRLRGFSLWKNWRQLPLGEKAKSVFGTARRILQRGYRRPQRLVLGSEVSQLAPAGTSREGSNRRHG